MNDLTTDENRTEKLCALVNDDVSSRQKWLERQAVWYAMRHDGIRRKNKPWPHAADQHYPLCDTTIDKFKPFYFNQLFGTEVIAQFIPKLAAVGTFAGVAGYWFDWKIKQQSNLESEILIGIDRMLMCGHAPVKLTWDADKKRLAFDAIEPTHCIVPDGTEEIQQADRVTLVHHFSKGGYMRDSRFTVKDEETVARITGGEEHDGSSTLRQSVEIREGITHSKSKDTIIVWEIWENTTDSGWWVHFISPRAPEIPLRASQKNPFKHGKCPVVRFDCEKKDKGHYSSRGVPEKLGAFETYACKVWNEKSDAMSLYNRPMFTSANAIPNAGNLKMLPGQITPGGISAIVMPRPPISFDEELNMTRAVAEQNIGVPDYGIGANNDKNQPRTATEVKEIGGQQGLGVDLRSRTFRMGLGELLQIAWETLLQYDPDTQFYVAGEAQKLPPEVLQSGAWMVIPNGSSESWNKQGMLQKAIVRKQLFAQSTWINQPELDRSILELDDPRLVDRLFMDPNQKQKSEYEDEAQKIPTLMLGMTLQGDPGEDQMTRIKCLMDFLHQRGHVGAPVDPVGVQAIMARVQTHLAILKEKDPKTAMGVAKAIDAETQKHVPQQALPAGPAPSPAGV